LLFDLGASREPTDIACDKDQMIGKAIWSEHLRKILRKDAGRVRQRARSKPARR
jgi:hypothetical protein